MSESTWSPHTAQGWFDSGLRRANSSRYGPGLTRSMMANCSAGLRECSVTGALNQVGWEREPKGAFPRVQKSSCSVALRNW